MIRNKAAQKVQIRPEERARIHAMLDRVSADIGAAWTSNISALEAVQEQRREL